MTDTLVNGHTKNVNTNLQMLKKNNNKKTKFSAKAQLLLKSPSVISAMVSSDEHHSKGKHQRVHFIFVY